MDRQYDSGSTTSSHDIISAHPGLRESDLMWLRRGNRLGQAMLGSTAASYSWVGAFVLIAGSLVMAAMLGSSEPSIVTAAQR